MYSATLLDHFENPRNSGELPSANVCVRVENPVCADVLEVALHVIDGRIVELRFKAKGCVPSVACASMLTELLKGEPIASVEISAELIEERIGGLPPASAHAAQLATEAWKTARREALKLGQSVTQHG